MEAGRVGGCERNLEGSVVRTKQPAAARKDSLPPFPAFPEGKAGAGGFPPRRQKRAAPPARGPAPLRDPPGTIADFYLTETGLLMEAARKQAIRNVFQQALKLAGWLIVYPYRVKARSRFASTVRSEQATFSLLNAKLHPKNRWNASKLRAIRHPTLNEPLRLLPAANRRPDD